ncbi:MAG: GNAT family N-acetyltransferase [Paracoccaceae bacterium]
MNFHITSARSLDAGGVGEILSDATDEAAWMPRLYSRAEELKFAGEMIDAGWVEVARNEGQIAGFLARSGAVIHCLYLARQKQRQGVGRALLDRAKSAQEHLELWVYQRNTRAQKFYRAMGFVEAARTDGGANDAGLPDIRYEWRKEAV